MIILQLQEKRNEKKMSQRDLANASGISQTEICHYENGRNFPTIPRLVKLAKVFGCEWHELVIVEGGGE